MSWFTPNANTSNTINYIATYDFTRQEHYKLELYIQTNNGYEKTFTAEFDIIFGKGICKIGNILDVAVDLDIVKKAGSWFSFNDDKLGQGRDKAKEFLGANPEILNQVETLVREKLAEN